MATLDPPQVLDTTRAYRIYLESDQVGGSLAGLYSGSETLSGRIWSGEDQATVVTPTVVWDTDVADNPDGVDRPVLLMTVPASALTSVAAGTYLWQITVDFATEKIAYPAEPGTITFIDGPGSATAPAVYGTRKDLLDVAPWIEQLQAFSDTAGFADLRGQARVWLEDAIHAHSPFGLAGEQLVPTLGASYPGRSQWLIDALADGELLVTGRIKRIVSYYAAGLACLREIGKAGDGEPYERKGARLMGMAESMLAGTVVELDTDADGEGDVAIDLSYVPTIRG
jgi:hypothetical protein